MNYQGYLTDGSGKPLNGTYDLEFQLFDDILAGSMEWGPETHIDVPVTNGIFQVVLGTFVTLYPNDFDEALFLAVAVDGTDVTPRQPLHSVPYAFGLVPGAEVQGDPNASFYALSVDNTGLDANDYGLYAKGEKWGIYAEDVGTASDVGIFSPDFVQAKGYKSTADTYLWVPGNAGVLYPTTGCTLYTNWHASARLQCSTSGYEEVNIPITVPGPPYGQDVFVESITVYYDLDNPASYITRTDLRKQTPAGQSVTVLSSLTDRTSTSPTSYSISATDNYTLTTSAGMLNLYIGITHDGSTLHDVTIVGVRIRLGHSDQQ
jgi:hypothetical protein